MKYQLLAFVCISLGLVAHFVKGVPVCDSGFFYDALPSRCLACPQNPKDCAYLERSSVINCLKYCSASSCILPKHVVSTKDVFLHGESATFKCKAGKILVGLVNSNEAICDNGSWKYVENGKVTKVTLNKVNCVEKKKSWGSLFGR